MGGQLPVMAYGLVSSYTVHLEGALLHGTGPGTSWRQLLPEPEQAFPRSEI